MAKLGPWLQIASVLSVVNVVLLATLTVVWARNYRTFRTPLIAGLVAFSAVLLLENLIALFFFQSGMRMLYAGDAFAQQVVLVMRGLETLAVGFLTYVTMQ
jgi:predicted small integral membrane protein